MKNNSLISSCLTTIGLLALIAALAIGINVVAPMLGIQLPWQTQSPAAPRTIATPVGTLVPIEQVTVQPGQSLLDKIKPTDVPLGAYFDLQTLTAYSVKYRPTYVSHAVSMVWTEALGVGEAGQYITYPSFFGIQDRQNEIRRGAAVHSSLEIGMVYDQAIHSMNVTVASNTVTISASVPVCTLSLGVPIAINTNSPDLELYTVNEPSEFAREYLVFRGVKFDTFMIDKIAIQAATAQGVNTMVSNPDVRSTFEQAVAQIGAPNELVGQALRWTACEYLKSKGRGCDGVTFNVTLTPVWHDWPIPMCDTGFAPPFSTTPTPMPVR